MEYGIHRIPYGFYLPNSKQNKKQHRAIHHFHLAHTMSNTKQSSLTTYEFSTTLQLAATRQEPDHFNLDFQLLLIYKQSLTKTVYHRNFGRIFKDFGVSATSTQPQWWQHLSTISHNINDRNGDETTIAKGNSAKINSVSFSHRRIFELEFDALGRALFLDSKFQSQNFNGKSFNFQQPFLSYLLNQKKIRKDTHCFVISHALSEYLMCVVGNKFN